MCFSAQASFIASGLLGVIGALFFKKAKTQEQSLAFIPFYCSTTGFRRYCVDNS